MNACNRTNISTLCISRCEGSGVSIFRKQVDRQEGHVITAIVPNPRKQRSYGRIRNLVEFPAHEHGGNPYSISLSPARPKGAYGCFAGIGFSTPAILETSMREDDMRARLVLQMLNDDSEIVATETGADLVKVTKCESALTADP
ncbi:hypothetical protein OLZ32_37940 [Rhizobium sp. 1AS11]|uniref:hypothetical protein n=1 Tax=Rhizobium acaciae TaxID=2989736 RepID=UPI002221475A|nr:hypothetical protein [Rhizobium acaciae]MCW1413728.1 hypothetical protein [Rhizobium acaciae]MCW1746129.1 hypothetical protein [Rhizobium acaciae]